MLNLEFDEDEEYFYFIRQIYDDKEVLDSEIFDVYDDDLRYQKLLECYFQIFRALRHIHREGFYHGHINPSNILIDRNNHAFLLDFGASYFYEVFQGDERFYSPEQLGLGFIDGRSDIFSFGLCMLKLLLDGFEEFDFEKNYKSPRDLDSIFTTIVEDYELEEIENNLFLLIKKMCAITPEDRIELSEVEEELNKLYALACPRRFYEINCHDTTVKRCCENNGIEIGEGGKIFGEHLEERTRDRNAYIQKFDDKEREEEKIEIVLGDLVFECSMGDEDDEHLFCYKIFENQDRRAKRICEEGIEFRHDFGFTIKGRYLRGRASIEPFKEELERHYKEKELQRQRREIDLKAIKTEEALLKAEETTINQKKNTQEVILKKYRKWGG